MAKKSNQKILSTFAAAFCFVMFLSFLSYAATGTIQFSDPSAKAGDTFDVTLKLTSEAAFGKIDLTLKYPSDSLQFNGGDNCDGGAGVIRIHGDIDGSDKKELKYTLHFKALKAGSFSIAVDSSELYDAEENPVELSHTGSSAVSISAQEGSSSDAGLISLQVSPGELSPAFDISVREYTVSVGLDAEKLMVDAKASDEGANVSVLDNEGLVEGENTIRIVVTAPDGTTSSEYIIHAIKSAEGTDILSSSAITESQLSDGVQLSSKGKTITVIDLPEDVQVPECFRKGTISFDGASVQGWVCTPDDSSEPEYVVVYGMNDQGEMNFYRYDRKEKTIQRYFAEPEATDKVSVEEFNDVQTKLNETTKKSDLEFVIICALGVLSFGLLIALILVAVKSSHSDNPREVKYDDRRDRDILKHEYTAGKRENKRIDEEDEDETVIISNKRKDKDLFRTPSEIPDETVVIKKKDSKKITPEPDGLDGFEEFNL